MKKLKTPVTLRFPEEFELPHNYNYSKLLKKVKKANIVEGFTINKNKENPLPFEYFSKINVDNDRLWDVFQTLLTDFPNEVSLIFCAADNEKTPFYGKYMDKKFIFETITKYKLELTQDCFFAFGIIHQTDEYLKEVFIDSSKYINYWGMDESGFRKTMRNCNLKEIKNLQFVDEFPKVRESLKLHIGNIVETEELIDKFIEIFEAEE